MKAALIESPGVLVVRDIPVPAVGEYDVLCRLLYGATCSGTDQHLIHNRVPWRVNYPTVLGHESVGRATQVGSKVRYFKVGDLITRVGVPAATDGAFSVNWGGFAEWGIARDHRAMKEDGRPETEWQRHRVNQVVPPSIDPRSATMIITWRETLSYLLRMGFSAGKTILIIGSGGNGFAFAVHALNIGAAKVAMVGSPRREKDARLAGIHAYFNYAADKLDEQVNKDQAAGYDFIIDAVGKKDELDKLLPAIKPNGSIGIYGIDDYGKCLLNPSRARGTFTYCKNGYAEVETHAQVIQSIIQGKLEARMWMDLDHPYPLVDIQKAYEACLARKCIKALIKLSDTHDY
jgi:L-iditol 2-dehydrogenase